MKTRSIMTISLHSTLWCFGSLILIIPISALVQGLPWIFSLLSLPLVIFTRGLMRGNTRTFIWMCFVTLLYFCIATDKVFGTNAHPLDLVELESALVISICLENSLRIACALTSFQFSGQATVDQKTT